MDPGTRRKLWAVIQQAAQQSSVVLTTHHLEEVEVLGDRVAIMVSGALRCIGTLAHLKTKFGSGLEVVIKVNTPSAVKPLIEWMQKTFPDCVLLEEKQERCTFALPFGTSSSSRASPSPTRSPATTSPQVEEVSSCRSNSPQSNAVSPAPQNGDGHSMRLSTIFQQFIDNKDALGIQDYSISQGSLEHVFLRISNDHQDPNAVPDD